MNNRKMSNTIIKNAEKGHMKHILLLIQELAEFEKMPEKVKISTEILERDGFDLPSPLYYCKVAETTDLKIVGYALYYNCYSTWLGKSIYLEDLYVKPEYRKQNIGKKLFLSVAKEAYDCGTRLDFSVLSWNPAKAFYRKLGAINITESEQWNTFRMDFNALKNVIENKC